MIWLIMNSVIRLSRVFLCGIWSRVVDNSGLLMVIVLV